MHIAQDAPNAIEYEPIVRYSSRRTAGSAPSLNARLLSDGRLSGRSEHGDRRLKPAKYWISRSLQPGSFGHPILNLCVGGSNPSSATTRPPL
jgi:hypothetical protein